MERWAILLSTLLAGAATLLLACTSDTSSGATHVHVGCDAGACTEDFTIIGICAQDRPHMCFCGAKGNTSPPSADCIPNDVKPPPPNTQAYCCP